MIRRGYSADKLRELWRGGRGRDKSKVMRRILMGEDN